MSKRSTGNISYFVPFNSPLFPEWAPYMIVIVNIF